MTNKTLHDCTRCGGTHVGECDDVKELLVLLTELAVAHRHYLDIFCCVPERSAVLMRAEQRVGVKHG